MALSDKLTELINTKEKIRVAIEDKGQDLNGIEFKDWFTKILDIPGGSPLSPSVGPSYLDTLDEADQIKDYGSKWESISDTLIELTNAKENIRLAIEDKGQDLIGIEFRDYDLKISDIAPQGFKTTGFGNSNGILENDSILTRTTVQSGNPAEYVWNSTLDDIYPFNVLGAKSTPLVENGNTMLWVPPYYWTPTLSPEGYLREITISEQAISSDSILSKGVWIGAGQTNESNKSATGYSIKRSTSIELFRSQSSWTNSAGKRYGAMNFYDWQSIKILMWVYFKSVRADSTWNGGDSPASRPSTTFKTSGSDITSYYNSYSRDWLITTTSNYFFGFGYLLGGLNHYLDGTMFRNWDSNTSSVEMYATDDPSLYSSTSTTGYNFIYRTPASGYIKEVTVVNGLIVPAVTTGASRTTYYGSAFNTAISSGNRGLSTGRNYKATTSDSIQDEGLNRMGASASFTSGNAYTGSRLRREE